MTNKNTKFHDCLFIYLHIINRFTNQSERFVRTVDVRHHQHLRLRQSLLQVVEVDGAVEGEEAHPGARIPRQPERQYKYKNPFFSELVQTEKKHLLVFFLFSKGLTYPGCRAAIHTGASGNLTPLHYGIRRGRTGRWPAEEVATEKTNKNMMSGDVTDENKQTSD